MNSFKDMDGKPKSLLIRSSVTEHGIAYAYTRGHRRRVYPPYRELTLAASKARKVGKLALARKLSQQAQSIPSRDPNDPNFRRLWYTRYADDFLLGLVGSKSEALDIKQLKTIVLNTCARENLYTLPKESMIVQSGTDVVKLLKVF